MNVSRHPVPKNVAPALPTFIDVIDKWCDMNDEHQDKLAYTGRPVMIEDEDEWHNKERERVRR